MLYELKVKLTKQLNFPSFPLFIVQMGFVFYFGDYVSWDFHVWKIGSNSIQFRYSYSNGYPLGTCLTSNVNAQYFLIKQNNELQIYWW